MIRYVPKKQIYFSDKGVKEFWGLSVAYVYGLNPKKQVRKPRHFSEKNFIQKSEEYTPLIFFPFFLIHLVTIQIS